MDYYDLVEDSLSYIEENLDKPLDLESVSNKLNVSRFYFHRIFSAVMGTSLNHYILSRRLNASLQMILKENDSLTDIAYALGFGTQASFTRAFKRYYGYPPSHARLKSISFQPMDIPQIIRRPFKNLNGTLITEFNIAAFEGISLLGLAFEIDLSSDDYKTKIRSYVKELIHATSMPITTKSYLVYSNCQPNSSKFRVLFGIPIDLFNPDQIQQLKRRFSNIHPAKLPRMYCARFVYAGDLLEIGDVFKTDFAKTARISRLEIPETDIELIQEFETIAHIMNHYHILVPIKEDTL
ncbi:AraC family transcriptional regulator [Anoxynatronum buryatiense]|uniref:AraC family transcriptional regulator n=2 Tax=Anoxynatronum buryatiense TaxID=489973 RepID=A0AA46AJG1_9CLOT|nr:AraC family transcriptional regulator [Anoxynatronum buryatiense]SMP60221.1 AraC family transcriptional regulator [Anoxynatronum buryatiense]